ncbi:hypothetical protein AB5N19_10089 [Seiridium cardinale]
MSSSEARPTPRQRIPGTSVFNWQSPETPGTRPLIRRPATACEPCRNAKAKCDGNRQCDRCKSRGHRCTYATTRTYKDKAPNDRQLTPSTSSSRPGTSNNDMVPEPTSFDISNNAFASGTLVGNATTWQIASGETEWPEEAFASALEEFDWEFTEDTEVDPVGLFKAPLHERTEVSKSMKQMPTVSFSPLPSDIETPSLASSLTGMLEANSGQSSTAGPSDNCQCRAKLMHQVPNLNSIVQERLKPRLDRMFKVTNDVIMSCHSAANCANCRIGPVDLVYILTMFQQTAFCFDYIAKSGKDENINIGIGDYQIQMNGDPKLKNALVLNLVGQASDLLNTLDAHKRRLSLADSPLSRKVISRSPACLNQLNLGYAHEVILKFRKLFRLMTSVFEEKGLGGS